MSKILRALIREMTESSVIKEANSSLADQQTVWFEIVMDIFANHEQALSEISSDRNEMFLLLGAAISLSGNESDFGTRGDGSQRGYFYAKSRQQPAADLAATVRDYTGFNVGLADTSVGATQIKLSRIEGPEFEKIKRKLGISSASDLDDVSKAIIVSAKALKKSYDKAKSLGYSTDEPGVNENYPYTWKSTGNAALDLALAAYNGDPELVLRKWCGTKGNTYPCDEADPSFDFYGGGRGVAVTKPGRSGQQYKNYIPRYGPPNKDPKKHKGVLSYIERVAERLPLILADLEKVSGEYLVSSPD